MLFITSPAKTLDFVTAYPIVSPTQPLFLSQTIQIAHFLKKRTAKQLEKIYHTSSKIAQQNYERNQSWNGEHTNKNSRPALFAYDGDIYQEMYPKTYTPKQIAYAQESLRIISGLYGFVRPLDLIQPYRLEMNAKLSINKSKNLYNFWRKVLTEDLNKEIKLSNHTFLINLASEEYFKAIDFSKLTIPVITINFLQKKNGTLQNIGLFSKHARGMVIEYCIQNQIEDLKKLQGFSTANYRLLKHSNSTITFIR